MQISSENWQDNMFAACDVSTMRPKRENQQMIAENYHSTHWLINNVVNTIHAFSAIQIGLAKTTRLYILPSFISQK